VNKDLYIIIFELHGNVHRTQTTVHWNNTTKLWVIICA